MTPQRGALGLLAGMKNAKFLERLDEKIDSIEQKDNENTEDLYLKAYKNKRTRQADKCEGLER